MSFLKKLAGQTALYGLSSMLGRALTFLLFPFYAAVLAPSEFGVMTELYSHTALLNIIYLLGMETAYFRFANRKDLQEREVFNNAESLLFVTSIFLSGIIILSSESIAIALDYPGKQQYITWLAIILATDAIVAVPFARLRFENKAGKFAFIKIFNIVVNVFLNLFFLVLCRNISKGTLLPEWKSTIDLFYIPDQNVAYVFLSNLIANALLIPIFWRSFKNFRPAFRKNMIGPMFEYAYPLIFMGLAGMVNESFSRIMLRKLLPPNFYPGRTSEEALGIFGACYRLSVIMNLAIQSFRYAAEPFFFSQSSDKNAPAVFANIMKWFLIVCVIIFLGVSLNLELLGKITMKNPVYREGLVVVPFLLLANLFLGVYYNLSVWFKLTDKTYYGTFISIGGAIITILLNFLLIPFLGYLGSAITTLLCYFLMSVVSFLLGQKHFPIPYQVGNAFMHIGIGVLLVWISMHLTMADFIVRQGMNFSLFMLYILILFLFEKKQLNFKKIKNQG